MTLSDLKSETGGHFFPTDFRTYARTVLSVRMTKSGMVTHVGRGVFLVHTPLFQAFVSQKVTRTGIVIDPAKMFPSSTLIVMHHLVVVCHTVCAYIGGGGAYSDILAETRVLIFPTHCI